MSLGQTDDGLAPLRRINRDRLVGGSYMNSFRLSRKREPEPTRGFPRAAAALLVAMGLALTAAAEPDLIVGEILPATRWGTVGSATGYSIGHTICNIGTSPEPVAASTNRHPITTSGLFRLQDGRFEQIGLGWVVHEFCALATSACSTCTPPTGCELLGTGCSTSSTSSTVGSQPSLGPRSEVNPVTAEFLFPFTTRGQSGNAVYKRLQAATLDIDPAMNIGARYFIESQTLAPTDAAAGNNTNNSSHRPVRFDASFNMITNGPTVRSQPALAAWATLDPGVRLSTVDVPGDGRLIIASRAYELNDGRWAYEYAVQNINSHRAVSGFSVPIGAAAAVTAIGFHDVPHHSGEPYNPADWSPALAPGTSVSWTTDPFAADPNANAIRWGTLYNFRFEARTAPIDGAATLSLFGPPTSASPALTVEAAIVRPDDSMCRADINRSGAVSIQDCFDFLAAYSANNAAIADFNHDGTITLQDLFDFVAEFFTPCP
ncbi:MAG: hypothetical protein IT438_10985 [Phycisphaerales bacterium]|nr:hypothetical protein [Phycisphaerales bacterium]